MFRNKINLDDLISGDHIKLSRLAIQKEEFKSEIMPFLLSHPEIRSIDISLSSIYDEGVALIAQLPGLRDLDVTQCFITEVGAKTLSLCDTLETIKIGTNQLHFDGVIALVSAPKLKYLDITMCYIEFDKVEELIPHLRVGSIEHLILDANPMTPKIAAEICTKLQLKSFSISGCFSFTDSDGLGVDISEIRQMAQDIGLVKSLEYLNLSKNEAVGKELALAFADTKVPKINLSNNGICDEAVDLLSKNQFINDLDLSDNFIGKDGAMALSKMPSLHTLNLNSNPAYPDIKKNSVGDEGFTYLTKSKTLEILYVLNNDISENGVANICENKRLTEVDLGENHIGDVGAIEVSRSKNIEALNISNNGISEVGILPFAVNKTLKFICVNENMIGDNGIKALVVIPTLETLVARGIGMGNEGAVAIASRMPYLKFAINDNSAIDESGFNALNENDPFIRIKSARKIGVATSVPSLKDLSLFVAKSNNIDITNAPDEIKNKKG